MCVCVCCIHSSAKQLSINWVIVFTRLAPVIRLCVTSPDALSACMCVYVGVCLCVCVYSLNSSKAAVIKVELEESLISLIQDDI